MMGMESLLRSFGIDPDEIKCQAAAIGNGLREFNERLGRVESKLNLVMRAMKIAPQAPEPHELDKLDAGQDNAERRANG